MNKVLYSVLFIGMFSIFSLFGQEVEYVQVIKSGGDSRIEWSISNNADELVVFGSEFLDSDTSEIVLAANTSYKLYLSVDSVAKTDTFLVSLQINYLPIILVLADIDPGDYEYAFYTGVKKPQLRIVGGSNADIENFPWQVCVLPDGYLCGGSILSEKWIITAAHCVFDDKGNRIDATQIRIIVGTSTPFNNSSENLFQVKKTYIMDEYDINGELYDIALLELQEGIDVSNAEPIDLIASSDIGNGALDPGVMGWTTGWGYTNTRKEEVSSVLQKVELPIVSNNVASQIWKDLDDSFLMAGYKNGGKDACRGDSGGPFVVKADGVNKLAGVVSWGSTNCDTYGAYTRISAYENWIRKVSGIKSLLYLDVPTGDKVVCVGTDSTEYYTDIRANADYQWRLFPDSAGVISFSSNTAKIHWDSTFIGKAELKVRAVIESDTLRWVTKDISIANYTSIKAQSGDSVWCEGDEFRFSVDADGFNLKYNWYYGETELDMDSSVLIINNVQLSNAGIYYCDIIGSCGSERSQEMESIVYANTKITDNPKDFSLVRGESVLLEVEAIGEQLSYQWLKDGVLLKDENFPTLVSENLNATNIGNYKVVVSGVCGEDQMSDSAFVFVKGVNKGLPSSINISPTITGSIVKVAVDTSLPYNVELFSTSGKRMMMIKDCLYDVTFSIAHLPRGVYLLRISNPIINAGSKILKED